jgi:hypothetical protein
LQNIALTTAVAGRKIVAISKFDIEQKEHFAEPLFNVLRTLRFNTQE